MRSASESVTSRLADLPTVLSSDEERHRRAKLLTEPHIRPLTTYLKQISQTLGDGYEIPSFDPLDGGINARALLLLEAPGPKAICSTFVSRDNPDPTARNLCELLSGAGIPRHDTLIWNIVPWYVGDAKGRIRAVTANDIRAALPHLASLLGLLSDLQVIVLVGKKAQSVNSEIRHLTDVPFVMTHHPSARVFNIWPTKRREAEGDYRKVATVLKESRIA